MSKLRVFGCVTHPHIPDKQRMKLNEKSRKSIFVGDPEGVKGFTFYDPLCREFVRSRDVRFREKEFHDFDDRSTNSDANVFPIMIEKSLKREIQNPTMRETPRTLMTTTSEWEEPLRKDS